MAIALSGIKGVVLAGGLGTRMYPLTKITNKHLLPIYNKPMIYYPIEKLVSVGIREIMVVTGGNHAGEFLRLLGNGRDFGLKELHYTYQEGEGGIAEALNLTRDFVKQDRVCVMLGDNIFEDNLSKAVAKYMKIKKGSMIFLKEVNDPKRFGVPDLVNGKVVKIDEKPKVPKSKYAVTGIYLYDNSVFKITNKLKPSARGELEITDVNNAYIMKNQMYYEILSGWWTDAGTFESLHRAGNLIADNYIN